MRAKTLWHTLWKPGFNNFNVKFYKNVTAGSDKADLCGLLMALNVRHLQKENVFSNFHLLWQNFQGGFIKRKITIALLD